MTRRVVVTGATGLLGRQVLKAFDDHSSYEAIGLGFSRATDKIRRLDIRDENAVNAFFDEVKPQVVIHCAANRQPDSCTADPAAARVLNNDATAILDTACANHGASLLYISTDYVFPGIKGEAPYSASHPPSPPNTYGETKWEGEKTVLRGLQTGEGEGQKSESNNTTSKKKNVAVLRVPVLYGETEPKDNNKESAVNVLMDNLWRANQSIDQKETVKMDDWAIRYPTNTADVARVIVDIAEQYYTGPAGDGGHEEEQRRLPQILQFSSEDRMTKYEICEVFAEVMGLSMANVVRDVPPPVDESSGAKGTVRPYDCHLSTEELSGLGIDVRTVDFRAWWRRYVGAFRR